MFDHFRWLVQVSTTACKQTLISEHLSKYGGFSDVQLLELVTDSTNQFLASNLQQMQDFFKKWMPSFSGVFAINEFGHINPMKRVSVSRTPSARSLIKNSSVSLIDSHIKIEGDTPQSSGCLGIEEALDLSLLCPFNPVCSE